MAIDKIDVTKGITGVLPTANLGSGTASSSTVLYGDQTYKTAPSAGLVHMATTEITSNTANVTFISGTGGVDFNSGAYENFLVVINGLTLSDDDDQFRVAVSIDAGSNYNAQTYRATNEVEMTQSGSTGTNSASAQSVSGSTSLVGAGGNNSGNAQAVMLWCFDFNSTTVKKYMYAEVMEEQHNLIYKKRSSIINIAEKNAAIDGLQFGCNAGNVAKGKFRVYGINKG